MQNIVVFLALSILSCAAYSKSVCNSQVTKKIESCAESNFKGADSLFNHVYRTLATKWNGADAKDFQQTQRYWIKYKTKYRQAALMRFILEKKLVSINGPVLSQ